MTTQTGVPTLTDRARAAYAVAVAKEVAEHREALRVRCASAVESLRALIDELGLPVDDLSARGCCALDGLKFKFAWTDDGEPSIEAVPSSAQRWQWMKVDSLADLGGLLSINAWG